jgi:transposase
LDTNPTFGVFFMAKYEEKFKRTIVQKYLTGIGGYKALGAKYEVASSTVSKWVGYYRERGDAGLRKKFSHYSARFKLSVLKRMWRQELSYSQVAVLFDLRGGAGVVSRWERQYHEGGLDALEPTPRGRPKQMKTPQPPKPVAGHGPDMRTQEDLRKENDYLRAEVAYLKKLDALARAKKQAVPTKRKP